MQANEDESLYRYVFTGPRSFVRDADGLMPEIFRQHFGYEHRLPESAIRHGGAVGFDSKVNVYVHNFYQVTMKIVKPRYEDFPNAEKYAPIARNREMVDWASEGEYGCLIAALHKDETTLDGPGGTKGTIRYAIEKGLDVHIYRFDDRSTVDV